ncbi:PAS domain-containing protein [Mucilaginibacter celer]|uniref:histidine kinase n=1 Tax=Mucilaginibacter celer TaxID=2305508 RepID=A0A494W467_9SPHI|nr:PAS domain-containing protein [Mucilaginibacter celer]AYL98122.1 PAS domain-containing protein [Mucilaginibacter celer]
MITDHGLLQILSRSKDATAVYDDENLRIRFANDAMLTIWGKNISVVGKTFEEAIPEIAGQPFGGLLKTVWKTGETYKATEMPATLVIDGEQKTSFFDFEYCAIKNLVGDTIAILHTAADVSDRKHAREQLGIKHIREQELMDELSASSDRIQRANDDLSAINRDLNASNENISRLNTRLLESEMDFRRLVAQAPVAILVFRGPELVIELANPPMLEILHKDASIVGRPILDSMPELRGEPAVALIFEVYRTGKGSNGYDVPVKMMHHGVTEIRYFNFCYRPLLDNGVVVGVMDLAVEVTDQVLARMNLEAIIAEKTTLEENLRANERRLQGILDTMAEGVVIVDHSGRPIYANPMAQKIMGLSETQFLDRAYNDTKWQNERLDGSLLPIENHPMQVVLQTGMAIYDQEIGVVFPDREKIFISVNAAPLIDAHEQVSGCIVTFTDVTNRIKTLREKDDFISVASHELKTPLTSLKASLQILSRLIPADAGMQAKMVQQANRSMDKLSDLVNVLLNTNKVSQGQFQIHKTTFILADLISDCCQHVRTTGTHTVRLEGDLQLEIMADEQLIDQVIVNLVNNAVKYAPDSKDIIIDVRRETDAVKISVTDFGPGIPAEKQKHIFDRYYRAEHNIQVSGIGLGLYICAEIIRKHGGRIGVISELGKGSTLWFTLPLI